MITDRNKLNFVTIYCCICFLLSITTTKTTTNAQPPTIQAHISSNINEVDDGNAVPDATVTVRNFSPRVDYNNEWRPLGHGDPLKNDPTFDYSPPALDRVRYWAESSSDKDGSKKDEGSVSTATDAGVRKTSGNKKDYLMLGVAHDQYVRGHPPPTGSKNSKGEAPKFQPKYSSIRRSYYANQLPTHLMPPPMQTAMPMQMQLQKKAATAEHRHNMPSQSYMSSGSGSGGSSSTMSMSMYSKPYYSTTSTSPWMQQQQQQHTSAPIVHYHHAPHIIHDPHHQESVSYFSYSRPSATSSQYSDSSYSPNSIRAGQNTKTAPRKPWVHELLQKELVKPVKPTMSATKYLMGTTKPMYESISSISSSTPYMPVSFVTTTMQPTKSTPIAYSTTPHVYVTSPIPTTMPSVRPLFVSTTQPTSSTTTSSRLLIPNTSNLAHRPTVAPMMTMTTDSLFSHYNQPNQPLIGPMYLIIEGHSKVKKYGKDEIDLHQPKIVPIVSKREPVVRVADPNDKPGALETFQVKHLHTKTTPASTTIPPPTTTTPARASTTAGSTTKKISSTTTLTNTTTTTTEQSFPESKINTEPAGAPTGMQSLLSFLDASLDSLLKNKPAAPESQEVEPNIQKSKTTKETTKNTILKPVITSAKPSTSAAPPTQQLEARISHRGENIQSTIEDDDKVSEVTSTTEPIPREVRQSYDYDNLPESRLKDLLVGGLEAVNSATDDDYEELADEEYADDSGQFIKRIDKLVNSDEDDADEELGTENNDDDNDNNNEEEVDAADALDAVIDADDDDDDDNLYLMRANAKTA